MKESSNIVISIIKNALFFKIQANIFSNQFFQPKGFYTQKAVSLFKKF